MSERFESTEEFRKHLKDKMKELVGAEGLGEGNRRLSVMQEWRSTDE